MLVEVGRDDCLGTLCGEMFAPLQPEANDLDLDLAVLVAECWSSGGLTRLRLVSD